MCVLVFCNKIFFDVCLLGYSPLIKKTIKDFFCTALKKKVMTINDDVCQNMNAVEILCYLRSKYSNVGSRSNALTRLRKVMMKKKMPHFVNNLDCLLMSTDKLT